MDPDGDEFKVINSNGYTKPLTSVQDLTSSQTSGQPQPAPRYGKAGGTSSSGMNRIDPSSNLIDLNTYILCSTDGSSGTMTSSTMTSSTMTSSTTTSSTMTSSTTTTSQLEQLATLNGSSTSPKKGHDYVNTKMGPSEAEVSKDPFDMRMFSIYLISN